MPGFDDLVLNGQPAVAYDGVRSMATEGRQWLARLEVLDGDGLPIDFTGCTALCQVWERSTLVTTIPVNLTTGQVELTKEAADTVGLAAGVRGGRRCAWGLVLTKGTVSAQIWGPDNSFLTIHNATGV
ncbi:hypothetical protein [Nocardioides sp.]|uniref:hypothetical protein n=1 Tax=Nocardioides sp. TaxID=35761 RepID=UPI0035184A28